VQYLRNEFVKYWIRNF